ncbi:MAG TPA: hypothetical protein VK879_07610 [Candidatus Sulfomarinibacteraceae bacterium]|nr:hypothetical protein [Candidatus Sulfomarinibacteraceae bacterium]
MAEHSQVKALDLVGEWSRWLVGANLVAVVGCVMALQGGVEGTARAFLLLAIGSFTFSLMAAALLLGLLPGLAERLPVRGDGARRATIYDGRLWGAFTVRLVATVQFALFLLAAAAFLGWVGL